MKKREKSRKCTQKGPKRARETPKGALAPKGVKKGATPEHWGSILGAIFVKNPEKQTQRGGFGHHFCEKSRKNTFNKSSKKRCRKKEEKVTQKLPKGAPNEVKSRSKSGKKTFFFRKRAIFTKVYVLLHEKHDFHGSRCRKSMTKA